VSLGAQPKSIIKFKALGKIPLVDKLLTNRIARFDNFFPFPLINIRQMSYFGSSPLNIQKQKMNELKEAIMTLKMWEFSYPGRSTATASVCGESVGFKQSCIVDSVAIPGNFFLMNKIKIEMISLPGL